MEQHEKLKLLRGLYCLTQEEMAALAKCHRSVYSTVESAKNDSRRLTDGQASTLSELLRFDDWWFNIGAIKPLVCHRLVFIDMDWSQRHLAATTNVRCRRINDAERAVRSYLPKMLLENAPVRCSIGQADSDGQLFFFLFDQQGLLLRTVPGQQITAIIQGVQSEVDSEPQSVSLSDSDFKQISRLSPDAVLGFLRQCNLDSDSMELMQPEIETASKNHFDYTRLFGDAVRETALKAVCQEILYHGFTLDEVKATLDELRGTESKPQKNAGP